MFDRDYVTCTKAYFKKKRNDNKYCIFVVMEVYDTQKDDMDESNYLMWNL